MLCLQTQTGARTRPFDACMKRERQKEMQCSNAYRACGAHPPKNKKTAMDTEVAISLQKLFLANGSPALHSLYGRGCRDLGYANRDSAQERRVSDGKMDKAPQQPPRVVAACRTPSPFPFPCQRPDATRGRRGTRMRVRAGGEGGAYIQVGGRESSRPVGARVAPVRINKTRFRHPAPRIWQYSSQRRLLSVCACDFVPATRH